jgi:hypothetical protein
MQMYALARNTSSSVVKRTTVSLINAHCLSSLASLPLGLECSSVDSDLEFVGSSGGAELELPGVAPEPAVELETDGKAAYAI